MKTKKRQLKNLSKSNNHPKGEKNWGTFLAALGVCAILTCVESSFGAGLLKPINSTNANDVFLKSHQVNVTINNGFARTEVDQIFTNKSNTDLEAIYSFPIPKQASLSELSLWINGKEVIGEVLEKEKARQIYTRETQKRVDPALAEKNSHRTFDISVYPVVANDDTRLRLVYYQPIEINSNIGRYVYPLSESIDDGDREAFWSVDSSVSESINFELELKSAFPVSDVRVPGYQDKAEITSDGVSDGNNVSSSVFNVKLNSLESKSINKDIVVYYKLDENTPARVELVPYKKDASSDGTFMVVVTPAADLKKISEGTDWTFVLDTSGSMRGPKINTLIQGVSNSMNKMSEKDRFRIITFNNDSKDLTKGYLDATQENITKTIQRLDSLKPNGGTQLYSALMNAYKGLDKKRTTAVILATDGDIQANSAAHSKFLSLLEEFDIRLFTFVIGNGSNQPLMEQLAKDSGGFAMNVSESDDISGRIAQAITHLAYENMHDVELKFHGEKVKNVTPSYISSLYRGQQLVMFGQYSKPGDIEIELKAKVSGTEKSWICNATLPKVDTDNPELERLWALSSIEDVMQEIRDEGENEALRKKVVKLGMDYSLVTDYTSMLVLEEHRYKELNIERKNDKRVKQERQAQQARKSQPVKSYRVDNQPNNNSRKMFDGKSSPGFGSGPVGPAFIALAMWIKRKKQK